MTTLSFLALAVISLTLSGVQVFANDLGGQDFGGQGFPTSASSSKSGSCPTVVDNPCATTENECTDDGDCLGTKKCCLCPSASLVCAPSAPSTTKTNERTCSFDSKSYKVSQTRMKGDNVCTCNGDGSWNCVPPPSVHLGECPENVASSCNATTCSDDGDCETYQKCCHIIPCGAKKCKTVRAAGECLVNNQNHAAGVKLPPTDATLSIECNYCICESHGVLTCTKIRTCPTTPSPTQGDSNGTNCQHSLAGFMIIVALVVIWLHQ